MDILFFVVAFLSSIVGAICGIGGGVVIKPVLDMLQMGAPATINFLSGCTVLSMSLYSVSKALRAGDSKVEMSTGTPLALGAAAAAIWCAGQFSGIATRLSVLSATFFSLLFLLKVAKKEDIFWLRGLLRGKTPTASIQ